jgi:SnoaL-like polyketide cyclase
MKNNGNLVRAFIDDVLNHGNIEATGKYFHEDVVEQAPFPGQGPGLSGLKDVLRGFRAAFPDIRWSVEEQIEEGDKLSANLFGVAPIVRNSWEFRQASARSPSGGSPLTESLMGKLKRAELSWTRLA